MLKKMRHNAKDFYILYTHFYQNIKIVSRAILAKYGKIRILS